jgi:peptidoglycan/LPS O-acetylase OafA/YrhL/lysophospholipase L1-like esterase
VAGRTYVAQRSARPARSVPAARQPPAINGLGGVAIVAILLYDTKTLPAGVLGVELFLVVSGFLVTLPLLHEAAWTGRTGIAGFYRRRLKYVVISLTVTLGLTTALVYLVGSLQEARRASADAVAALLQVANWHALAGGEGRWDQFGRIDPLGHLWLVSLVEQLCLVWPLFVALLCWVVRRSLGAVTVLVWVAFGAASVVAPAMYDGTNGDRLYLGTDSHAVAFLAGAAAACAVQMLRRRRSGAGRDRGRSSGRAVAATAFVTVLGTGAVAVLVAATVLAGSRQEPWLYRGGLAGVAAAAALLAAALCYEEGPLFRFFSWGPLAEIGRVSYLIYLVHLPIYWLLTTTKPQVAPYGLVAVGGGLSWLLSMILHYGIAERLRRRPWQVSRAVPVAAACAVVTAGAQYLPAAVEKRMNPDGRPVALTLGDSVANDMAMALADHGSERFGVVDGGVPGCGVMSAEKVRTRSGEVRPAAEACLDWERRWRLSVRNSKPRVIVVHLGADVEQQRVGGRWLSPCDPAYRRRYAAQLGRAARIWADEAPTARVLLMNERTVTGTTDAAAARCYNAVVQRFAVAASQVELLDLDGFLCAGRTCRQDTPDGEPLYSDRVHFSRAGMGYLAGWLEKSIGPT